MNKKSIRSRTTKPVQKSLPAAVHAAAMALDGETAGAASEPFAVDDVPASDVAAASETHTADAAPATPAESGKAKKAEKPGKPVKFSFTLPATEAAQFDALRHAHQVDGVKVKKSVLLRAALTALAEFDQARLAQIVSDLQPQKPAEAKAHKPKSKK